MSIKVLEQIRQELLDCRAVSSNRAFCEGWLAKDESYLRVLRFHGLPPSADALGTCASKLGYYAYHLRHSDKPEHLDWVERFLRLRAICFDTIERQGKSKWMTPTRMGL
ncbi:DUF6626 family protein [Pseudophaeobacter sp. TrK17]|uniref:DUF6626 family protein n=1 Tax=Pseudophaeobacter sp. TrK17 TaxID=2815167 RepID=UPI0035CECD61